MNRRSFLGFMSLALSTPIIAKATPVIARDTLEKENSYKHSTYGRYVTITKDFSKVGICYREH